MYFVVKKVVVARRRKLGSYEVVVKFPMLLRSKERGQFLAVEFQASA